MLDIARDLFKLSDNDFQDSVKNLTEQWRWGPFAKGGEYSPFYSDIALVLNWWSDGREAKAFAELTPGTKHWSRRMPASEY
jgi:hypothetical protein